MTLKEVQIAVRMINNRSIKKNRFEAALHGVKLQSTGDDGDVETQELDQDKQNEIDNNMRALAMQKQMEMSRNGRRKG